MKESTLNASQNRKPMWVIGILSVAIPLVVAFLLFGSKATRIEGLNVSLLPHLNAILNSATFVCLLAGGLFIRQKNIAYHRAAMTTAFVLSSVFLVSYVIYHNNADSTPYGGEGILRTIYFFILITHILLAMVVVPLVLMALYYAWTQQISRHKKIVKWTYPVWVYVAATGVLVYWMISPYYVH
ncbi:DUF420 domain-containing protein [Eisenibacter elegans]|jgi:putative membrane protein|uniref:DUF420 domain-containing protein n=1 Tax=Eisenibacter elegans TaxID=997 RepID=UPI00047C46DD|nr:DUF420 domain-containing protein [Eisenibacter elegans]